MALENCRLIDLPKVMDNRGNLTFIEAGSHIPFEIKRVYYLYDVPGGAARGGHAHKQLEQFIIAAMGSFDVVLDDGFESRRFHLNRSYYGLYVPSMIWRELDNFSSGSVCLTLASDHFSEEDYVRERQVFRDLVYSKVGTLSPEYTRAPAIVATTRPGGTPAGGRESVHIP